MMAKKLAELHHWNVNLTVGMPSTRSEADVGWMCDNWSRSEHLSSGARCCDSYSTSPSADRLPGDVLNDGPTTCVGSVAAGFDSSLVDARCHVAPPVELYVGVLQGKEINDA